MMKKLTVLISTAALVGTFQLANAQSMQLVEGRHYTVLANPVPPKSKEVVVTEFFSYVCPHCADFEETFGPWTAQQKKKGVVVESVPVSFKREEWTQMARLFYALQTLKLLTPKVHEEIFETIHEDKIDLWDRKALTTWLDKNNLDSKKIIDEMGGFTTDAKLRTGDAAAVTYRIGSVPTVIVDGKYTTANSKISGFEEMLQVIDALILKARQDRQEKSR